MIAPGTFVAALRDLVDPSRDGPRDGVTFAYRGSVYVRLAQFQEWLTAHGEDGSQAAARAVMSHYGFVRAPFTVRDAQGEVTSRSVYRSMNPDLVEELPEWPGPRMGRPDEPGDPPDDPVDDGTPGKGQGRLTAAQRYIIEKHAEDLVDAHYTAAGWAVNRVGDQRIGWDLTATRAGDADRHVEVKGSRGPGDEVELTANELAKAREHPGNAVLAIVSGIELVGDIPAGGTVALIAPWDPEEEHLAATRFRYRPPHDLRVAV